MTLLNVEDVCVLGRIHQLSTVLTTPTEEVTDRHKIFLSRATVPMVSGRPSVEVRGPESLTPRTTRPNRPVDAVYRCSFLPMSSTCI